MTRNEANGAGLVLMIVGIGLALSYGAAAAIAWLIAWVLHFGLGLLRVKPTDEEIEWCRRPLEDKLAEMERYRNQVAVQQSARGFLKLGDGLMIVAGRKRRQ